MPEFLNNAALLDRFVAWRAGPDYPERIPEPIVDALMLLVQRLADRLNFSGYSFIQDMQSAALLDCVRAARNFDPEKSKSPFNYFTTCAWYAFSGVIRSEKKQRTPDAVHFSELAEETMAAAPDDGAPPRPSRGPFETLPARQLHTLLKVAQGGRHRGNSRHVLAVCTAVGVTSRAELLTLLARYGAPVAVPLERQPAPGNRVIGRQLRALAAG